MRSGQGYATRDGFLALRQQLCEKLRLYLPRAHLPVQVKAIDIERELFAIAIRGRRDARQVFESQRLASAAQRVMGIASFQLEFAQETLSTRDNHRTMFRQLLVPEFEFDSMGALLPDALEQSIALRQQFVVFV